MRPSPRIALLRLALAVLAAGTASACSSGSTQAGPTPSTAVVPSPTVSPSAEPATAPIPTSVTSTPASPTAVPTARPLETAPPPGAPTCKAAALTVTDADELVTQQSREEVFVVRTTGPDCGLTGFPKVTLKSAGGTPLAARYAQDGSKPTALSLSKGTSVSFSLTSARSGSCVDASSLSVVLPGTGAALSTSTSARVCNGAVTVSPIRRLNADS